MMTSQMSEQGEPPAAKQGGATVAVVVGHGLKLNFKKGLDLSEMWQFVQPRVTGGSLIVRPG